MEKEQHLERNRGHRRSLHRSGADTAFGKRCADDGQRYRLSGRSRRSWGDRRTVDAVYQPGQPFCRRIPIRICLTTVKSRALRSFGVACCLYYPYLFYWLRKKKDRSRWIGTVLFLSLLFQAFYLHFEIPVWLAKVTLLSSCNRMQTVFGYSRHDFYRLDDLQSAGHQVPAQIRSPALSPAPFTPFLPLWLRIT